MKKTIITLVLVAASAFAIVSNNASAHGGSGGYGMMGGGYGMMDSGMMGPGMMGPGMMNGYRQGTFDDAAYQTYQKDTADIRAGLAADMTELNALMAGTNPDAKRARALSESISAKQNQLVEAARKNNIKPVGNGWYCNRW